jgi:hypothetical protein
MFISRCLQLVTFLAVGVMDGEVRLVMAYDRLFHGSERERERGRPAL